MRKIFIGRVSSFLVVLAVILLLIFFDWLGWLLPVKNAAFKISRPVLKVFEWSSNKTANGLGLFFTLKDLVQENVRLQEETSQLWRENTSLKAAARENEVLRERLMLPHALTQRAVLARVIGRYPETGQIILINKGADDGLAIGLAVVTSNDFLVGRVVEAGSNFAKVTLINDSNSSINAITENSRLSGVVRGAHGLEVAMEMIPVDSQINNNEVVLTSGLNEVIPGGLIIGRVGAATKKENDIWQRAVIEPAANLKKLEQVFIVLPR